MNTYSKFVPNVFLAKTTETFQKGDIIEMSTKYGNTHDCVVFNLIYSKDGFNYYSIVRADGFNNQTYAQNKADKLNTYSANAEKRSNAHFEASNEGRDFLSLGQPILIGHHSEKRHRALIERNHSRMGKCVEESKKAETYAQRAVYWEKMTNKIDLSMPESIEYFEYKLEIATARQKGLKDGTIPREHNYSLTYASKDVKELTEKVELAKRLWL